VKRRQRDGGKYLMFTYDSAGRRASSLDQLGHRLNYYYDVAGRLQSMTNELNALVVAYGTIPPGAWRSRRWATGCLPPINTIPPDSF